MLRLGYKKAHKFIEEQKALGNDVRWDGWTMVFFRAHPAAMYSVQDGRPNGVWSRTSDSYGFETRVEPNEKGLWEIDWRNVKSNKHSRS
jgi:hypothetical protein